MHYIKKFWVFLFIGILLFPISAFINKAFAHPHNFLWIEATSKKITIHSLHKQKVSLEYLKKNFILENCQYSNFSQDMTHYEKLGETLIFIPISNCPALIIFFLRTVSNIIKIPTTITRIPLYLKRIAAKKRREKTTATYVAIM